MPNQAVLREPHGELSAAALNPQDTLYLLVERDGVVRYASPEAESLFMHSGLVKAFDGNLATADTANGRQLKTAVAETCANGSERVIVFEPSNHDQPLVARVLPFDEFGSRVCSRALVLVRSESGRREALMNALRHLFRLSPAEASIAAALAAGADLKELSAQRSVKLSTLRSQVASIMAKTGTRKQVKLIALVARIERAP